MIRLRLIYIAIYFAVAARVIGYQPVGHRERGLERHPSVGAVAESLGRFLHPARPPVCGLTRFGEAALVVEPAWHLGREQADPHGNAGRLQRGNGGFGTYGKVGKPEISWVP